MLRHLLLVLLFSFYALANIPPQITYDANDNRIAKTTSGGTTTYLVDANTPFAQVITESKSDGTEIKYTYGNDLLSDGEHSFLTDALGSTRGLVDSTGALTDSYVYTPYGELANHDGASENNFLFTGEQLDSETDEYYLRARYYSPSMSRFVGRDGYDGRMVEPITVNHYAYANSSPAMFVDPSGNCSLMSLNNVMVMTSILAVGTSYSMLSNNRGEYGGNIWLTVGIYNAQTWILEEYAAMVMYAGGGKQTTQSPFKYLEDEFLDMNMNDPCKKIEEYIEKMKEQVKWREGDLEPKSDSYKGHLIRIKRLNDQIKLLAGYLAMGFCRK